MVGQRQLLTDGAFKVQYSSSTVPSTMNQLASLLLFGLLLCVAVQAAFEDFVVSADTQQDEQEMALSCEAPDGEQQELELEQFMAMQDGQVDAQQLLATLMQQAERLGINFEQLMQIHSAEQGMEQFAGLDEGCSAVSAEQQQPSWYDVFFN